MRLEGMVNGVFCWEYHVVQVYLDLPYSPYFVVIWFDGILWHRSWYILVASAKCSWRATMSLVGGLLANAIHARIKLIAAFLLATQSIPCTLLFFFAFCH